MAAKAEITSQSLLRSIYFLPAIVALAAVFIIFKFTIPQFQEIMKNRQTLGSETERLERLKKKASELEAINEFSLRKDFENAEIALPSQNDVVNLLYTIANLENETQVFLDKIDLAPGPISTESSKEKKVQDKPLSSVKFEVAGIGDLTAVTAFLKKIKEINPQMEITQFKIDDSGQSVLKAKFEIVFYYQRPPKFIGKVEDPPPVLTLNDRQILDQVATFPAYKLPLLPVATAGAIGKPNPFE